MNRPLGYLREILSNYTDRSDTAKEIDSIIRKKDLNSEDAFVRMLSQEQIDFLEEVLPDEIHHAQEAGDDERVHQLNEVYELLY